MDGAGDIETGPDDAAWFIPTSRRQFLALLAGSAAAAVTDWGGAADASAITEGTFTIPITRAKDLVDVTVTFVNLRIATASDGSRSVVKQDATKVSYLRFEFPPQHVAEESLFVAEGTSGAAVGSGAPVAVSPPSNGYDRPGGTNPLHHRRLPLKSRIARSSRIVFAVNPSGANPIPYTIAGLLGWTNPAFSPSLAPTAAVGQVVSNGGLVPLVAPTTQQTSIEFPYGLIITPTPDGRWRSRTSPVTRGNRTEVWSPRLTNATGVRGATELRAIWTTEDAYTTSPLPADPVPPTLVPNPGFLTLPNQRDKYQLVRRTTDRPLRVPGIYGRAPTLTATSFRLSSIGATANIHGTFTAGGSLSLEGYVHRAFAGRDVYVKTVKSGRLYPTGHGASLVTVMERVFAAPAWNALYDPVEAAGTGTVAYLQEYTFLVVRERTRRLFAESDAPSADNRGFPFSEITIHTETTPTMTPTAVSPTIPQERFFFPFVGGSCFAFDASATDRMGATHKVRIPLAFVSDEFGTDWTALRPAYDAARAVDRTIRLGGLKVSFAPELPSMTPGSTSFPTLTISMLGCPSLSITIPRLDIAEVLIEGLATLGALPLPVGFRFPQIYLQVGFGGINGLAQVFGELTAAFDISFPDLAALGGLLSPDFSFTGLSASFGCFGGAFRSFGGFSLPPLIADFDLSLGISGSLPSLRFDPGSWFSFGSGGGGKILGGLDLGDLLSAFSGVGLPDLSGAIPGLTTRVIYDDLPVVDTKVPVGLAIDFQWSTDELKDTPSDPLFLRSDSPHWSATTGAPPNGPTTLSIAASTTVQTAVPKSVTTPDISAGVVASATLSNFEISLFGSSATTRFVVVEFESLVFSARTGAAPTVTPNIRGVDFDGALSFVKELAARLAPEGGLFSGGSGAGSGLAFTPIFDVTSSKVAVGFELGVPTIALGAFSLANLEVGMLLTLPFTSDPMSLQFHVCRAARPFTLSVGILGGGGFFSLDVGLDGIHQLEASLEFGATAQLDIGIASGGVSIMAGIHFTMRTSPDDITLTGYFRANGHLSIMGIVSISAEILLSLTYVDPVAKGRAKVSFKVEVVFFSKTFETEVEREFAGGGSSAAVAGSGAASLMAATGAPAATDFMAAAEWDTYQAAFA